MKIGAREIAAVRLFLFLFLGLLTVPSCHGDEPGRPSASSPAVVTLPPPSIRGETTLEEAIQARRSVRSFSPRPLTLPQVSQLLWAAGGKTIDGITGPTRSYPSAGGIYSLSILLASGGVEGLPPGIYRYDWERHSLHSLRSGDHRDALARASYGQGCVGGAPAVIVIAGDISRTADRYGERGENRYVPMDAGHSGQNVSLQAQALGLGSVIVGAFRDEAVKEVLGLERETPLYLIPAGYPSSR